jgi:hypothetical protein
MRQKRHNRIYYVNTSIFNSLGREYHTLEAETSKYLFLWTWRYIVEIQYFGIFLF